MELLLDRGADPRLKGEFGRPVLMAAISNEMLSLDDLEYLISQGADPFAVDCHGCDAVDQATCENRADLARWMAEVSRSARWQRGDLVRGF